MVDFKIICKIEADSWIKDTRQKQKIISDGKGF
jgi:hypothetical protein